MTTGGASLIGTAIMWTGAVSTSVQVGNSVARLTAIYTGHGALVDKVDHIYAYKLANDALDFAGIFGSGGAFKEVAGAEKALGKTGLKTWDVISGRGITRPARRQLTQAL